MDNHHKKGGVSRMNQLTPKERSELGKKGYQEKINPSIPKATHSGILKIGETELECAVVKMPNGEVKRLLLSKGVLLAMGRGKIGGSDRKRAEALNLPIFLNASNLKPFIPSEMEKWVEPIYFKKGSGKPKPGYDYRVLTSACETYLRARDQNALSKDQMELAKSCEMLMRSFSQVGLVSLIDEVSGYQEIRDRNALQILLDKYLRAEFAEWAKRFPDEFYKQIFRLNNWKFGEIAHKRPSIIGKYTNDVVYSRLLPELVDELEIRNPKNEKGYRESNHHQWLNDVGNTDLNAHIRGVVAIMKATSTWKEFKELLDKIYPVKSAKEILLNP